MLKIYQTYRVKTLEKSIKRLQDNNFDIIYSNEYYPILKFFDLGAIAYFAKIIEWEFIDFSVEKYIDNDEMWNTAENKLRDELMLNDGFLNFNYFPVFFLNSFNLFDITSFI